MFLDDWFFGVAVEDCPGSVVGTGALNAVEFLSSCSYHLGLCPGVIIATVEVEVDVCESFEILSSFSFLMSFLSN